MDDDERQLRAAYLYQHLAVLYLQNAELTMGGASAFVVLKSWREIRNIERELVRFRNR